MPPSSSRTPPRFWPLAVLILLPVLVLAGVAAWFLAEQRRTVGLEAEAVARGLAATACQVWESFSDTESGAAVTVLYEAVPLPGQPSPAALVMERAAADGDFTTLMRLADAGEPQGRTASGLPVRVMAAWILFRDRNSGGDAQRVARLAVDSEPSVISSRIVAEVSAEIPDAPARWAESEVRREEFRRAIATGLLPPAESPDAANKPRAAFSLLVRSAAPGGEGSDLHHIRRKKDGSFTVTLHSGMPRFALLMVERFVPPDVLKWAKLEIREAKAGFADGSTLLAAEARPGYTVLVHLIDKDALYFRYRRMVWWCMEIVGGALLVACLALWLVRRTLTKERRLGEMKSQFVSSVSHELRAPVSSLRLMAEGLASGKITGPAADEFHRLMAGEGARLSSLIENVLDFARIEQGRKEYHCAETDVPALVHDAVNLMTPQAEARGLKLVIDAGTLPFSPQVDAGALQQALINLIDNAIKFTPPNAVPNDIRVNLSCDPSRNLWSLSVTDPGIGIPRGEHERIFDRFYRLGNELRRETTGTGIGLAIVKHIVEGHGGVVTVRSEVGKGSEFRMEFSVSSVQFSGPCTEPKPQALNTEH